jgi:hypothetical protein
LAVAQSRLRVESAPCTNPVFRRWS